MQITPGLIDVFLIAIIVECAVLIWLMRRMWLTRFIGAMAAFLLSGAAMMGALRSVLVGAPDSWVSAMLAVAGLLHIGCLYLAYRAVRRAG